MRSDKGHSWPQGGAPGLAWGRRRRHGPDDHRGQRAGPESCLRKLSPRHLLVQHGGRERERERKRERGQCCRGQETDLGCTHPRAIVAFITARTKYADINKQAEGRRNALCRFDSPCGRVALARSITRSIMMRSSAAELSRARAANSWRGRSTPVARSATTAQSTGGERRWAQGGVRWEGRME